MEAQAADLGLQVMARPVSWGRDGQQTFLQSCTWAENLLWTVAELWEVVRWLPNVREAQKESDKLVPNTACRGPTVHGQTAKNSLNATQRRADNAEEWKLARERTSRRKRPPPRPEMPLQNHFTALQTEEERPVTSGQTLQPSSPICSPYNNQCN